MRLLAFLLCLLPLAASAQSDPLSAYQAYHQAAVMGNLEMAGSYASLALRPKMFARSPQERADLVNKMRNMMPATFSITRRTLSPDRKTATFSLAGRVERPLPQATTGEVRVIQELGKWKVDSVSWVGSGPEKAAAAKAQPAAKSKVTISPNATPLKSPAQRTQVAPPTPDRTLGKAKEPCVFKPVMTPEDLERCK